MNIYLLTQRDNVGYDTYDSAVVYAADEASARNISPSDGEPVNWDQREYAWADSPEGVTVQLLGVASSPNCSPGLICASFNAG
jgi:hypothetical protein